MPEHGPSSVGVRVGELREVAGISARQLDRLADITPGHTSAIETRTQTITLEILSRIARVFGVSLDWLANGGERPSDAQIKRAVARAEASSAVRPTGT